MAAEDAMMTGRWLSNDRSERMKSMVSYKKSSEVKTGKVARNP